MKLLVAQSLAILVLVIGLTSADERKKRQAYGGSYTGAAGYRQQQPQQQQQQYQQQQPQYQPQAYSGQQVQHYPQQPAQQQRPSRPKASEQDEEEKDNGPHPLQLLLENSKFECGSKSDGYYADSDVGCQAFHYCVSGHKHSMMCPAGTVFHQVHLNCVPADQDICSKANKFYFVNDYLNKPLEQRGPNNTVQYHQRYYPDNYAAGDAFIPPQEAQGQRQPPAATYGLGPAYKEQAPAPHQPAAPASYQHQRPAAPAQYQHQRPAAPAQYQQQRPAAPAQYQQQRPAAPAQYQQPAAPYAPPQQNAFAQNRQVYQQQQQQPQVVSYGYGGQQQQQHVQQAQQAHRAYQQHQQQAAQPQQYQYGSATASRPRYGQQS